jgi:hypothetical protein
MIIGWIQWSLSSYLHTLGSRMFAMVVCKAEWWISRSCMFLPNLASKFNKTWLSKIYCLQRIVVLKVELPVL